MQAQPGSHAERLLTPRQRVLKSNDLSGEAAYAQPSLNWRHKDAHGPAGRDGRASFRLYGQALSGYARRQHTHRTPP